MMLLGPGLLSVVYIVRVGVAEDLYTAWHILWVHCSRCLVESTFACENTYCWLKPGMDHCLEALVCKLGAVGTIFGVLIRHPERSPGKKT